MKTKICMRPECATEFDPTHSSVKYCTHDCAMNARKKIEVRECVRLECSNTFEVKPADLKKYCSRTCATISNNKNKYPEKLKCLGCKLEIKRTGLKYCSNTCKQTHLEELWVSGELDGSAAYAPRAFARRAIQRRSEGRCEGIDSRTGIRCTEDRIVQLDHIDGNWLNNTYENLRHLCPTCHALTDTYGSKNKGRGRTWKSVYNQFEAKN